MPSTKEPPPPLGKTWTSGFNYLFIFKNLPKGTPANLKSFLTNFDLFLSLFLFLFFPSFFPFLFFSFFPPFSYFPPFSSFFPLNFVPQIFIGWISFSPPGGDGWNNRIYTLQSLGCCCIDSSVFMLGMIYKYRISRNVFGLSFSPNDNSGFDVRPAFPSELTHYLTLAGVWKVSYLNSP